MEASEGFCLGAMLNKIVAKCQFCVGYNEANTRNIFLNLHIRTLKSEVSSRIIFCTQICGLRSKSLFFSTTLSRIHKSTQKGMWVAVYTPHFSLQPLASNSVHKTKNSSFCPTLDLWAIGSTAFVQLRICGCFLPLVHMQVMKQQRCGYKWT